MAALLILMPLTLFFGLTTPAAALETKLTSGDGANHYFQPDISGSRVVWLGGFNQAGGFAKYSDVYLHTLGGSTIKLNSVKEGYAPVISATDVIWEDRRNESTGRSDIFGYPIPGGPETGISTNSSYQLFPDTDGGRVVWQDFRGGNWDIYLREGDGSVYRITSNSKNQTEPRIDGNLLIWTDDRNDPGRDDIYLYDLSVDSNANGTPNYKEGLPPNPDPAEQRITTDGAKQNAGDISGRKIVWTDWRSGRSIYVYDLNNPIPNGSRIDSNPAIQHSPRISGDKVVWTDWRNTTYPSGENNVVNTDIYLRDLSRGQTIQLTMDGGEQSGAAISGSNVVWSDFRSRFTWDIYHSKYVPDTKAPSAAIAPPWVSTQNSKSTRFKVTWSGSDAEPSFGIATYDVQYKEGAGGAWQDWRMKTTGTYGYISGKIGRTYYFRARAKDKAGNQGGWSAVRSTVVPYDQESLIHRRSGFSGRYKKATSNYFLGTSRYSKQPRTYIVYKFYGNKVTLITNKGPNRSRAKIYLDGKHRSTVDAYASSTKYRQAIFSASWSKKGTHYIKVENLGTPGRPRFDIDALAVKDVPRDTRKPSARVFSPSVSSNISKTTTFRVFWSGSDAAPFSGVASYDVWYRRANSSKWSGWRAKTTSGYGFFRGKRGVTYFFKVRARDFGGNVGAWSRSTKTIVPYNEDQKVFRRRGFAGTYGSARSDHYLNTVRYSTARNTFVAYKFYGNRVSLIGTRAKNHSRAKIYIDGKYVRTIDTYSSRTKYRQSIFAKAWAKKGTHYVKIVNLATPGRPRLDIDGVAIGR